jgi:hypothetical protein
MDMIATSVEPVWTDVVESGIVEYRNVYTGDRGTVEDVTFFASRRRAAPTTSCCTRYVRETYRRLSSATVNQQLPWDRWLSLPTTWWPGVSSSRFPPSRPGEFQPEPLILGLVVISKNT